MYRAHDPKLGRDVALKVLPRGFTQDSERRSRLVQEARAAASLNHPNICTVYDVGEVDGQVYLTMEIVQGQSLSARLDERPLSPDEVLRYGLQLAEAVGHAHDHGVVHRDLKSANVMITAEGRAKVVDFGLARRLSSQELADVTTGAPVSLTQPGMILGTLAYMAPEQLRGQPADERSDVWALGVVLYEMATRKAPFAGQTGFELSAQIFHDAPPPLPPRMPVPLQTVVSRCLEKEPARRYRHGGEVQAALETVQSDVTSLQTESRAKWMRRPGFGVVAGAALLLAAAVVGFVVNSARSGPTGRIGTGAAVMRLAVLPFDNLTGDPAREYFSDGLTEEMIAQLSRLSPQRLGVIARTSAMRYKRTDKSIDQIGKELGVAYILTGSARSDAGRVRVTAALVQTQDQAQLWSESYDRELADILALQDDVAKRVAGSLALRLLPVVKSPSAGVRRVNPESYDAYLKGHAQLNIVGSQSFDAAMQHFEFALQKDPTNALAYAGISRTWQWRLALELAAPAEGYANAKAAALKAIELDDARTEPHVVLGGVRMHDLEWAGAEAEVRRAIEIDPNSADARTNYAVLLTVLRRPEEAKAEIERSLALDPFNASVKHINALRLLFERRRSEAVQQWRALLEENPSFYPAHYNLWQVFHLDGRDGDALAELTATCAGAGLVDEVQALRRGAAESGYPGALRRAIPIEEAAPAPSSFSLAIMYVHLGDKNRAVAWLERGFDAGESNPRMWLGMPTFDELRDDPRFRRLTQRMNLPS